MPTQRDVAIHANVSVASVSRFLADPTSVRRDAAARIQAAIEELGYVMDYTAQCLRTGRFNHIGILAPDIGPFYWEMFFAIQARLGYFGYFSTLFFTRNAEVKAQSYRAMVSPFLQRKHTDGIIFFPTENPEDDVLLEQFKTLERPFIILDRPMKEDAYAQFYFDNYQGGREAALAFLEQGHREFIMVLGLMDAPSSTDRFNGFRDCLAEHGIALDESRWIKGEYSSTVAYETTREKLPSLPPFTAVFACNDASACGFIRAAHEQGLRCPRDYSIIGFDDNREFAPHLIPPLSSFDQPLKECGEQAADKIVQLINGETEPIERRVFKPVFYPRTSLGPVPAK